MDRDLTSRTVESLNLVTIAAREAVRVVLRTSLGEAGEPAITQSKLGATLLWTKSSRSLAVHINSDGGYVLVASGSSDIHVVHGDAIALNLVGRWVEWLLSGLGPTDPRTGTAAYSRFAR